MPAPSWVNGRVVNAIEWQGELGSIHDVLILVLGPAIKSRRRILVLNSLGRH
jgi:hypothetical protein